MKVRRITFYSFIWTISIFSTACVTSSPTKPPQNNSSRNTTDPSLLEARRLAYKQPITAKQIATKQNVSSSSSEAATHNPSPQDIQRTVANLLPSYVKDRDGWATDIQIPFTILDIEPSIQNICSVIALIEQESSFNADPVVPNLPKIAFREIYARGKHLGVPTWILDSALNIESATGKTYRERIKSVKTEGELSEIYEEMIDRVPVGKNLFKSHNPIRTAGAMQVSIAFAEMQLQKANYPYPIRNGLRKELFTRRGGIFFGVAHLLDYKALYDSPIYRFADYNAGRYSSRNAAFQSALTMASGVPIVTDGDLLTYKDSEQTSSATQAALQSIAAKANLSQATVSADLKKEKEAAFYQTSTYNNIFSLAEGIHKREIPRALLPQIELKGPKIQRQLTTAWFANRVNTRMIGCILRQK